MRLTLDIPHADVAAAALRCSLTGPRRAAVAALDVEDGPVVVRLRVLAASHQVEVAVDGALALRETVACDLAGGEPLDSRATHLAAGVHRIVTVTHRLDDPAYLTAVADATDRDDGRSLLARFGVVAEAVTLLRALPATPDVVRWESFHAYPQEGTVVHTRSTLELA